jgi:hypothetical protein
VHRKWAIYCLLGLLVFQGLGYHLSFLMQYGLHKSWAREHVEAAEEEKLTFLSLTDAAYRQLVWADKLEFWYQGVLHDLKVATQSADGKWKLLCFRDEHETKMLRLAGNILQDDQDSEESPPTPPLPTLSPFVIQSGLIIPIATHLPIRRSEQQTQLPESITLIPTPPPQGA